MADSDAPMQKRRPVRAGTSDCYDKWFREDPSDYPPSERGKERPQSQRPPTNEERARGVVKGSY